MNENSRYICTKEHPYQEGCGNSLHPDAEYLRDTDHGDEVYKCPNCGIVFKVELAQ